MTFLEEDRRMASLLTFAKVYLHIESPCFPWDYEVQPYDATLGWAGCYRPVTQRMHFNGSPAWEVVFHEAVHFQQHERGEDLETVYARFAFEPTPEAAYAAYWTHPFEVEARTKAREMSVVYRNRQAGLGAHWA